MHNKLTLTTLFSATLLTLTACGGGEKKTVSTDNDHPDFSWARVKVSNAYQPSGNIKNTTPTFKWKSVSKATNYQFGHEDVNSGMRWRDYNISANQAGCKTGLSCSYKPTDNTFAIGDKKAWWVRAKVGNKWKSWSGAYVFNVVGDNNPSTRAKQISPIGKINTLKPTFKWTPGNGATNYQLGYQNKSGSGWYQYSLTARQANCQATQCSYKPSYNSPAARIIAGVTKTWWIRAKINGTWTGWSNAADFFVPGLPADTRKERLKLAKSLIRLSGTATTADIPSVQRELSKLPVSLLKEYKEWNTEVIVVRGSIVEFYPELKGVTPRGWPANLTWDSVPGVSDSDNNQIVIATRLVNGKRSVPPKGNGHGSYNLVLHEIGHNYSSHYESTKDTKFIAARNAVINAGRLTESYHLQAGNAGLSETFAESFGVYYSGKGKQEFKYTEIYNYLQNNVAETLAPRFKTIDEEAISQPDGKPYIWGVTVDGLEL